jgi:proline dehydrogenase
MEAEPKISFDDTATAFSYKSDKELKKAHFIFSTVNHPWVSAMATGAVKLGLKLRLPIDSIIRKTVFDHFVGGTSIADSEDVIHKLGSFGVGTILDYSVEGEKSETGFDQTTEELIRTIEKAKNSKAHSVFGFQSDGSWIDRSARQNPEWRQFNRRRKSCLRASSEQG